MNPTLQIALCLLPVTTLAQVEDYLGVWCPQGEGGLMYFEEHGLGFGDHTLCDWKEGPSFTETGFAGLLTCRNVYVTGENADGTLVTVEMDHRRGLEVFAELMRTDRFGGRYLQVTVGGEVMPSEFGPCG